MGVYFEATGCAIGLVQLITCGEKKEEIRRFDLKDPPTGDERLDIIWLGEDGLFNTEFLDHVDPEDPILSSSVICGIVAEKNDLAFSTDIQTMLQEAWAHQTYRADNSNLIDSQTGAHLLPTVASSSTQPTPASTTFR